MILLPGVVVPGSAPDRMVRALEGRGHRFVRVPGAAGDWSGAGGAMPGAAEAGDPLTLLLFPAVGRERELARSGWALPTRPASPSRRLVVTRIGTHPDAPRGPLRDAWELEEASRGASASVLTLRLAPLLGPVSPLWRRLASRPRLPRGGRKLLNPVAEADAVETLDRALRERGAWSGWFEVAGPEVWSLAELERLACETGADPGAGGAWEPPLEELEAHKLAEAGPWIERFGIAPAPLAERARGWAAAAGSAV